MQPTARRLCLCAALLLALATLIGALGAHVLKPKLSVRDADILQTALLFQFVHALGLLGVGLLADRLGTPLLRAAGWILLAGIVLFCGSLYLLIAGAPAAIGVLTPLGGLCLIVAWCAAAVGLRAPPR